MPEKVVPGPVSDERRIREAVCIHTKKIFDSCKDKDCIEDLRVYPTRGCQEVIDRAVSVKAGCAELLYAYIDVEPVTFNRGFYTVDVRYFYRITADAFVGAARPVEITGLAVFDKRVILFGSEGSAKVFTSTGKNCGSDIQGLPATTAPTAVVESVDPIILGMKLVEVCQCRHNDNCCEIPPAVCACFPEELVTGGDVHRLFVTLGQFSIIRLERDTQLLMPAYDYCMPEKDCDCGCDCRQEDPCELFRKVQFPVGEFFPPNHCPAPKSVEYQDVRGCC
ncbi:MAG: hypothetical protein MR705_01555 [Flintibacter sp.]|jgi:hypothetical protein|uniref:hypothetical protein n=1 Tax=Flintibacter TaxID=1918454 RepID=UPI000D78B53B|nr:hypothetical protein [Flintibacter sp.]MCI6149121.1 hypothetical protein [Flintibacter sp.]MCI7658929.1 hypothetical protein [Flintibacter sp.]MDD7116575.1 hypothetical protein [Flintibacter sp.]MDY5038578.1 hypothetical protein [Lawsonibacter sp.]